MKTKPCPEFEPFLKELAIPNWSFGSYKDYQNRFSGADVGEQNVRNTMDTLQNSGEGGGSLPMRTNNSSNAHVTPQPPIAQFWYWCDYSNTAITRERYRICTKKVIGVFFDARIWMRLSCRELIACFVCFMKPLLSQYSSRKRCLNSTRCTSIISPCCEHDEAQKKNKRWETATKRLDRYIFLDLLSCKLKNWFWYSETIRFGSCCW